MPDDDMRVLLQLQPLSVSFAPKTFSLRPTQKIRIDLVGAGTSASPPRPDNGVFPSPALDRNSAHIVSSGSYFTLKTSAQESNHIRVNGYLLSNHPCTLKHGDIIEFGHASFVRYDEYYDEDGDYECWPCFSFAPDLSFKVHLTFPPRFDTRRVWTDPFSDPIAYVPPSSVPCIKPKISLSPTSSTRHPSPASTRALDHGPQISAPSSSPPRKSPAPQIESVSVSDAAAPHGTNWAGIAQLIEELHEAAPSPRFSSAQNSLASSSPTSGSPTVDTAHRTFCYRDFVGANGTALPIVPTGELQPA
ncbi:unnamed protein product [Tilletia controversa]|uniref:FHA domain-containing protein n=1 Tax=Tilletia controversa TaxID=13291 RepID=A0A8X7MLJ6_9BASI|nr:hypothetical protein A4X06_0g7687 [Tilletia controversa]CAD6930518.1 unnamed protein product [Tilletia controversa]CAD6942664.1 unnamed protein product [Tilletia controversa]CAD6967098.1 unnamed protein product [Tilletia controversa]